MPRLAVVTLLVLALQPGCSSGSGQESASAAGSGGAAGNSAAAGAAGTAGTADAAPGGSGGSDAGCDGCAEVDAGAQEGGAGGAAGSGAASGDVGVYGTCSSPGDCVPGLSCVTVVQEPAYGQCTHDCMDDQDCEASPAGNQVGCHPEAKICLSLCGIYGSDCPDGLVCTAHEVCLEPSNVTATKGPGEHCTGSVECLDGAECVEGDNTSAYCAPPCDTNEDCTTVSPGHVGQCVSASGMFNFCMYFCGMMAGGADCPGDLTCEGNAICR